MMENIKKVLLTEEQIAARVKELGAELTAEYKGKDVVVIAYFFSSWVISFGIITTFVALFVSALPTKGK